MDFTLSKKAITQIKNTKVVGQKVLMSFLGKQWQDRIITALELRKLEKEDPELLEATEEITTPSVTKQFQRPVQDFILERVLKSGGNPQDFKLEKTFRSPFFQNDPLSIHP